MVEAVTATLLVIGYLIGVAATYPTASGLLDDHDRLVTADNAILAAFLWPLFWFTVGLLIVIRGHRRDDP